MDSCVLGGGNIKPKLDRLTSAAVSAAAPATTPRVGFTGADPIQVSGLRSQGELDITNLESVLQALEKGKRDEVIAQLNELLLEEEKISFEWGDAMMLVMAWDEVQTVNTIEGVEGKIELINIEDLPPTKVFTEKFTEVFLRNNQKFQGLRVPKISFEVPNENRIYNYPDPIQSIHHTHSNLKAFGYWTFSISNEDDSNPRTNYEFYALQFAYLAEACNDTFRAFSVTPVITTELSSPEELLSLREKNSSPIAIVFNDPGISADGIFEGPWCTALHDVIHYLELFQIRQENYKTDVQLGKMFISPEFRTLLETHLCPLDSLFINVVPIQQRLLSLCIDQNPLISNNTLKVKLAHILSKTQPLEFMKYKSPIRHINLGNNLPLKKEILNLYYATYPNEEYGTPKIHPISLRSTLASIQTNLTTWFQRAKSFLSSLFPY